MTGEPEPSAVLADLPPRRTAFLGALAVGVVVALLIAVLATRDTATDRQGRSPLLGRVAPEIEGESIVGTSAGKVVRLRDYAGKWVVVNFFAAYCVPCQKEHPHLVRFAERHAAQGDAAIVGVWYGGEPKSDVRKFFALRGGDWPVIQDQSAAVDYGVVKLPESFLVDPRGRVVVKFIGQVTEQGLERRLAQAKAAEGVE